MKVRKTLIAAAVVALIPLGTAAIAGDNDYGSKDKAGSGANFKKLDANKDGRISQAEAAVDSTIVFSTADTNGDGYLDNTEWKAAQKGSNGNGNSNGNSSSSSSSSDPSSPQSMPSQGNPSSSSPSTTTPDSSTSPSSPSPDSTTSPTTTPPDTGNPR
jgi:hypothetical protein